MHLLNQLEYQRVEGQAARVEGWQAGRSTRARVVLPPYAPALRPTHTPAPLACYPAPGAGWRLARGMLQRKPTRIELKAQDREEVRPALGRARGGEARDTAAGSLWALVAAVSNAIGARV